MTKEQREQFNENLKREEERLAPNKFLQPLNYKKYKLVSGIMNYRETSYMSNQQKPWKEFFYRYSRNKGAIVGFVILAVLILCALFIPFFTQDPS